MVQGFTAIQDLVNSYKYTVFRGIVLNIYLLLSVILSAQIFYYVSKSKKVHTFFAYHLIRSILIFTLYLSMTLYFMLKTCTYYTLHTHTLTYTYTHIHTLTHHTTHTLYSSSSLT